MEREESGGERETIKIFLFPPVLFLGKSEKGLQFGIVDAWDYGDSIFLKTYLWLK